MPIINITNCPICNSSKTSKAFDAVDHFSTKETFPICDCNSCGFRFTNNFPSEDSIGRYYDSPDYISHSDSKTGFINRLYHFFRKQMLRRKVNLISKYVVSEQEVSKHVDSIHESEFEKSQTTKSKSNIRLLDIGSGTGYFLNAAKERGYTVTGIEKDSNARDYAITNFGLDVKDEQSLWAIENELFDVITLWHVLEHIENLNEVVAKINSILKPNGVVIIALPNHDSYDAKKYKDFWAAYDAPRHLWHFTSNTVKKLLGKHQFNIVKQKNMPLDAFYISMLSEKYRGSGSLMQYIKGFTVGAAGYMRSLSDINQSSSIIYIAKKASK